MSIGGVMTATADARQTRTNHHREVAQYTRRRRTALTLFHRPSRERLERRELQAAACNDGHPATADLCCGLDQAPRASGAQASLPAFFGAPMVPFDSTSMLSSLLCAKAVSRCSPTRRCLRYSARQDRLADLRYRSRRYLQGIPLAETADRCITALDAGLRRRAVARVRCAVGRASRDALQACLNGLRWSV